MYAKDFLIMSQVYANFAVSGNLLLVGDANALDLNSE